MNTPIKPTQEQIETAWQPLMAKLFTCASDADRDVLVRSAMSATKPTVVSFLNAHACNLAAESAEYHEALITSDYLLRDGAGVELHMVMRGLNPGINLNGTDLIPDLIETAAEDDIALYGTLPEHVKSAQQELNKRHVSVLIMDGFRPDEEYIREAVSTCPSLIVLGMGMPKQEFLSHKLKAALGSSPTVIVNGGAIIDFIAGRYPRAPEWIRKLRLESLYRLSVEPRRLWRRNLGSLIFLKRSLKAACRAKWHSFWVQVDSKKK